MAFLVRKTTNNNECTNNRRDGKVISCGVVRRVVVNCGIQKDCVIIPDLRRTQPPAPHIYEFGRSGQLQATAHRLKIIKITSVIITSDPVLKTSPRNANNKPLPDAQEARLVQER